MKALPNPPMKPSDRFFALVAALFFPGMLAAMYWRGTLSGPQWKHPAVLAGIGVFLLLTGAVIRTVRATEGLIRDFSIEVAEHVARHGGVYRCLFCRTPLEFEPWQAGHFIVCPRCRRRQVAPAKGGADGPAARDRPPGASATDGFTASRTKGDSR